MGEITEDFINDMLNQAWDIEQERDMFIWITKDGRHMPIVDMSTNHINNTIKMLERNDDGYDYIPIFKRVLKNRGE